MGRRGRLIVGVAIVVVVAAWWFVWLPYWEVSGSVAVVTDAEPLRCATGTVGIGDDPLVPEGDDRPAIDVVVMEPDMDCSWRFFVVNESSHEVTVERISVPILGPGNGGPGIQATGLGPFDSGPLLIDDTTGDVYWDVVDLVPPGERRSYTIGLELDETGCSSPAGITMLADEPTVWFRFRGLRFTADARVAPIGFQGTEFSSCDS